MLIVVDGRSVLGVVLPTNETDADRDVYFAIIELGTVQGETGRQIVCGTDVDHSTLTEKRDWEKFSETQSSITCRKLRNVRYFLLLLFESPLSAITLRLAWSGQLIEWKGLELDLNLSAEMHSANQSAFLDRPLSNPKSIFCGKLHFCVTANAAL